MKKERPILFSAPMVRAILDGIKTQTRRVVKLKNGYARNGATIDALINDSGARNDACPYGKPGDRLWVRETWRGVVQINNPYRESYKEGVARYVPDQNMCKRVEYLASQNDDHEPWRPSIHMPRWASRILLEIVSVRVERLNDISEADAKAEGVTLSVPGLFDLKAEFFSLWESLNGAGSWDANPWVWVVEFKPINA